MPKKVNKKDIRYLPALFPNMQNQIIGYEHRGFKLDFWQDNPVFNYKHILIAFNFFGHKNRRQIFGKNNKKLFIFGDSGGFASASQNLNINPIDVIKWQQQNCNMGVLLDVPPFIFTGVAGLNKTNNVIYKKALKQTIENIQEAKQYVKSNYQWWGVIQGKTFAQKLHWYKEISKIHNFKNWAISAKPSHNYYQIISSIALAYKYKIKNIHLFQLSAVRSIALLILCQKHLDNYFDKIYFDSSTPSRMGLGNRYLQITAERNKLIKFSDRLSKKKQEQLIKEFDCQCEVCKHFETKEYFLPSWQGSGIIFLHDFNILVQKIKELKKYSKDDLIEFSRVPKNKVKVLLDNITNLQKIKKLEEFVVPRKSNNVFSLLEK